VHHERSFHRWTCAEETSQKTIAHAQVSAYDRDDYIDDLIGEAATGTDGRFEITGDHYAFADFIEDSPDVVIDVQLPNGVVYRARRDLRWSAGKLLPIAIDVPSETLETRGGLETDQNKRKEKKEEDGVTIMVTTTATIMAIATERTTTTATINRSPAADGADTPTGATIGVTFRSLLIGAATSISKLRRSRRIAPSRPTMRQTSSRLHAQSHARGHAHSACRSRAT